MAYNPNAAKTNGNGRGGGKRTTALRNRIKRGPVQTGKLICIYGPGGVGKTTLGAAINPLVFDVEGGSTELDVARIGNVDGLPPLTFGDVLDILDDRELLADFDAVMIDSLTRCEVLATEHIVETVTNEKGYKVKSIEQYGYGKGYKHLFDTMVSFIDKCRQVTATGKHVILIAHECATMVPNPAGEDYQRWEPRLYQGKEGNNSIRLYVKEACDELWFIGYDIAVSTNGKGVMSGSRTLYPTEQAHCMAKSRSGRLTPTMLTLENAREVWAQVLSGGPITQTNRPTEAPAVSGSAPEFD